MKQDNNETTAAVPQRQETYLERRVAELERTEDERFAGLHKMEVWKLVLCTSFLTAVLTALVMNNTLPRQVTPAPACAHGEEASMPEVPLEPIVYESGGGSDLDAGVPCAGPEPVLEIYVYDVQTAAVPLFLFSKTIYCDGAVVLTSDPVEHFLDLAIAAHRHAFRREPCFLGVPMQVCPVLRPRSPLFCLLAEPSWGPYPNQPLRWGDCEPKLVMEYDILDFAMRH